MTAADPGPHAARRRLVRRLLLGLAALWAAWFLLGAAGDLLGLEDLRELTAYRDWFLR